MDYTTIKHGAIGLLGRREHSEHELRTKLQKKYDADEKVLDALVEELKELNYLSDERFAEMYVRVRQSKGFGPNRIIRDLQEKGISHSLSEVALESVECWLVSAENTWRKKFGAAPVDYKEKSKQMQFLRYRGFRHSDIESVISLACEGVHSDSF